MRFNNASRIVNLYSDDVLKADKAEVQSGTALCLLQPPAESIAGGFRDVARMEPMTMSLIGIQIHTFQQVIRLTSVVNLKYDDTVALTSSDGRCNDFGSKV
jgi:hypothetical protein